MSTGSATVIVPTLGGERLGRMLASIASSDYQTIVVDDGSNGGVESTCAEHDGVEVLRLDRNQGYSRAVNLGARRADGDRIVLLNDDCVCDPGFVDRIIAPLDPPAGVVMAAGVMRDWGDRTLIDSAGMELDPTLLVWDYLNGEPLSRLAGPVADPIGPSAAAAAFDRTTFLSVGGFDERLFAYWEDVDLVLRLRRLGLRCVLAADATGDHEHSATFGSGSARKNYLTGYGRGYVLRKWQVLTPRRLPGVLLRESALCAGQALVDRNVSGVRGRLRGYRAPVELERYPTGLGLERAPGALGTLRRRARRRSRLRSRAPERSLRALAVFHLADTSGPSRSLEKELKWLAGEAPLDVVLPGEGNVGQVLGGTANVIRLDYKALTKPATGWRGLVAELGRLWRDVRLFRGLIRERRPQLVIAVTTMLPAVTIAAWLERIPTLVYCGELFDRGDRGGTVRALANRALEAVTSRLADVIIACSETVAGQFAGSASKIETVFPPVGDRYSEGDPRPLRERFGIPADAPVLASVGYVTPGRRQDVLVRAMPAILERLPDARYVLAGAPFPRPQDIAYRDRLVELIHELGVAEVVVVTGHYENVADVYATADVIVNPASFNEPFGRVPFEAAIAGKPAVVTRVGAIPELLRDGHSALIVEPDDARGLAEAVVRVLSDPALATRLVDGAREIVAARLTPAHSLAGFQHAVASTIER